MFFLKNRQMQMCCLWICYLSSTPSCVLEPMPLQLLSKSRSVLGITAVVRCPGCPNPQSTPTHSFVAGPPAPAECPTPYQDPCSPTPQGPTLLTAWLHPQLWLILGVHKKFSSFSHNPGFCWKSKDIKDFSNSVWLNRYSRAIWNWNQVSTWVTKMLKKNDYS